MGKHHEFARIVWDEDYDGLAWETSDCGMVSFSETKSIEEVAADLLEHVKQCRKCKAAVKAILKAAKSKR